MLNKNFRYVSLDFETTGLDPIKDEAIQIGLVEIDIDGKIIREFKSFLKPQKDIKEIKDLVAYITGISIDELQDAPSIFDIKNEIDQFLSDETILIGHNIEFDLKFIKKYFPDIRYYDSLDTLYLAQTLVHFAPSYALDVLVEHLLSKKEFKKVFDIIHYGKVFDVEDSHDALFDSKNALCLFVYAIQDIISLIKTYPILSNFIQKNTGLYHKILNYKVDRASKKNGKIELPKLEKQLPSSLSLKSDKTIKIRDYKNKDKFFVGNVDISQLTTSLIAGNKNVILSFSSIPKLNIVKNMLFDMGIKNIGFTKGQLIINKSKFNTFLNKDSFSDNEILFIVKYLSHVRNGISVLDLNTKFDYKINYYIQDNNKMRDYPVVLTTHGGLFSILGEKDHIYKNYDICFFDMEMRYKSYNHYISSPCDLYFTLNFLETLYYKYTLDNNDLGKKVIEDFARFFEIFMGVIFSETKKYFINIQNNFITVDPILDHINFYETNNLIKQFDKHKTLLESGLSSDDFNKLWDQIDRFLNIISGLVQVNKFMYGQSDFYFVYSEATKFTNWDEFGEIFTTNTIFLSNYEKSYKKLFVESVLKEKLLIRKISDIDNLITYLNEEFKNNGNNSIFIISTIKSESKEIFEKMYNAGLGDKAQLLVENITGSLGKNVFKAKNGSSKIIVGGYNFMIRFLSNKINIDICIDFNIKGKMSQYLLHDIQRYAQSYKE